MRLPQRCRLASTIRACSRRGRASRPPRAALGIPPRPHQAGRAASGHAAPRRLAWPTQSRNEHAGPLAPPNPAAHHGGVFHCARLTGARGWYTFVTKAPFVTTEGNTNVSEGSATASRDRGSRQTRSVRVGGRAGGDGGHFAFRRSASCPDPRQAAPAGGGKPHPRVPAVPERGRNLGEVKWLKRLSKSRLWQECTHE